MPNIYTLISPDCSPLIIVWGMVVGDTNKTPCNTKDERKQMIIATFTKLNETFGRASRRFRGRLEAAIEAIVISLNKFNL